MSIWLWLADRAVSVGAIAVAIGLALRLNGMSHWIMWEVSALFENIGIVQDGIATLIQAARRRRPPGCQAARRSAAGEIRFEHVSFHYGKKGGVIEGLDLHLRRARRSAWSAAPAPASRRSSTCCCASTTSRAAAS